MYCGEDYFGIFWQRMNAKLSASMQVRAKVMSVMYGVVISASMFRSSKHQKRHVDEPFAVAIFSCSNPLLFD
jgi:hypothetical protein